MSQVRVRRSRLSPIASILMILLGLFTINSVNVYAGVVLTILGVSMYLVHRRLKKARGARSADGSAPAEVRN
jgi:hypothetical protein